MILKLKYTLLLTTIIIISSISFAINNETTVPIYLTVPEYLKITNLSKNRLDLYASLSNWGETVEDSLTFSVESNINYNLRVNFTVLSTWNSFLNDLQISTIESAYRILIKDFADNEIINTDNNSSVFRTSGIQNYSLIFQLDVNLLEGLIYSFTEGKIGEIQITVSSY